MHRVVYQSLGMGKEVWRKSLWGTPGLLAPGSARSPLKAEGVRSAKSNQSLKELQTFTEYVPETLQSLGAEYQGGIFPEGTWSQGCNYSAKRIPQWFISPKRIQGKFREVFSLEFKVHLSAIGYQWEWQGMFQTFYIQKKKYIRKNHHGNHQLVEVYIGCEFGGGNLAQRLYKIKLTLESM